MIKGEIILLGTFRTNSVENFGDVHVHDLRKKEGNIAKWYILQHENLKTSFILTDSEEKPIGEYVTGGGYLKTGKSINITEHVFIARWWPGSDTSRTGLHGTQHYAYLATDIKGMPEFCLSGKVCEGSLGMEGFVQESSSSFPKPFRSYDMKEEWFGVELEYKGESSVEGGWSPDHMRRTYQKIPSASYIIIDEERHEVAEKWDYVTMSRAIRDKVQSISIELEEALLVEDVIAGITPIKNLFQFYLEQGMCSDHFVIATYEKEKMKNQQDIDQGVLYDFSGHFRRMGYANNADLWVIRSDGSLREPDELKRRKTYPEGDVRWKRVEPEELAIKWRCISVRHPHDCEYEIVHMPKMLTDEQKEAVQKIETDIINDIGGVPGKLLFQLTGEKPKYRKFDEETIYSTEKEAPQTASPFAVLEKLKKS